jgi:hypothetical protein
LEESSPLGGWGDEHVYKLSEDSEDSLRFIDGDDGLDDLLVVEVSRSIVASRSTSIGFRMTMFAPHAMNRQMSSESLLFVMPMICPSYPASRIFVAVDGPSTDGL